ncbi:MAG: 3'(2'),5'-bisphosphate nucleotidase CysQ [Ilumatobacteraceae bacterium]
MTSDLDVARTLAGRAGQLLLELRAEGASAKWDPKDLKDRGDQRSNELLLAQLAELRPDDALLSEEAVDDPVRLERSRVWVIDPLDGTREFSELDRDDWAVHVALAVDGVVELGVVAIPARGELFDGTQTIVRTNTDSPRILISRTRPPAEAEVVAAALGGRLVPMGSAGAKTAAVLRGDAELYLHSGGQYEWDLAAPVAVALGSGLHASRIDGSPFRFNNRDPYLPDALIGHPDLARRALEAIAASSASAAG